MDQNDHNSQSWVTPSEKFKYDQRGRVIEKTDALGGRTLYYYDKVDRKTAEIGPRHLPSLHLQQERRHAHPPRLRHGRHPSGQCGRRCPSRAERRVSRDSLHLRCARPAQDHQHRQHPHRRLECRRLRLRHDGLGDGDDDSTTTPTAMSCAPSTATTTELRLLRQAQPQDRRGRPRGLSDLSCGSTARATSSRKKALRGPSDRSHRDQRPEALLRTAASGGGVRVTTFDYDKNGRRRFETRSGVNSHALDASGNLVAGAANRRSNIPITAWARSPRRPRRTATMSATATTRPAASPRRAGRPISTRTAPASGPPSPTAITASTTSASPARAESPPRPATATPAIPTAPAAGSRR
jgi:YD repeat-containing protein